MIQAIILLIIACVSFGLWHHSVAAGFFLCSIILLVTQLTHVLFRDAIKVMKQKDE